MAVLWLSLIYLSLVDIHSDTSSQKCLTADVITQVWQLYTESLTRTEEDVQNNHERYVVWLVNQRESPGWDTALRGWFKKLPCLEHKTKSCVSCRIYCLNSLNSFNDMFPHCSLRVSRSCHKQKPQLLSVWNTAVQFLWTSLMVGLSRVFWLSNNWILTRQTV